MSVSGIFLIVEVVLMGTVGFMTVYLMVLSLASLAYRKRTLFRVDRLRKFAVIIPAHNEETGIAATLESLRNMTYAGERFDIVVVADNCDDRTVKIAAAQGVRVLERNNPDARGKGYALRWAFDRLLADPTYEAFVVIDADTIVSGNFLDVMNAYLERGASAIQATDVVAPEAGPWNLEMIRIGFLLHNYVRPLGRRIMGCPTILHGNGMCFSRTVLQENPWNAFSLAEDVEYALQLMLAGTSPLFAPEAAAYAVMPHQQVNAQSQRIRWEGGRYRLMKKYWRRLLVAALKRRSPALLDVFFELVIPALVNLIGLCIGCLVVTVIATSMDSSLSKNYVTLWIGLLAAGFIHVFLGLISARARWFTYKALLQLPRYALWKFVTLVKNIRDQSAKEWIRTTREPGVR